MTEGFEELSRKLDKTVSELDVLEPSVRVGNKLVKGVAKYLVPFFHGELRENIMDHVEREGKTVTGTTYTNIEQGMYVELGTGSIGKANNSGISPEVKPTYTEESWWIHESQIDTETTDKYSFFSIDTKDGKFYRSSGQAAQPFLYPALKDNEDEVTDKMSKEMSRRIERALK